MTEENKTIETIQEPGQVQNNPAEVVNETTEPVDNTEDLKAKLETLEREKFDLQYKLEDREKGLQAAQSQLERLQANPNASVQPTQQQLDDPNFDESAFWANPQQYITKYTSDLLTREKQAWQNEQRSNYENQQRINFNDNAVKSLKADVGGYVKPDGTKIDQAKADDLFTLACIKCQNETGLEVFSSDRDIEYVKKIYLEPIMKREGFVKPLPGQTQPDFSKDPQVLQSQTGFNGQAAGMLNSSNSIAHLQSELTKAKEIALKNPYDTKARAEVGILSRKIQDLDPNYSKRKT